MSTLAGFRKELETLINSNSMENGSDTPDFILAEYLTDCLATFDKTITEREKWYGRKDYQAGPVVNEAPPESDTPF